REDFLRVPRDRDLAAAAGDSRRLRAPRSPRGLRDRPLGIAVDLVRARRPVLDRLHPADPAAGRAREASADGRRARERSPPEGVRTMPLARGTEQLESRMDVVGLMWDRYEWPLATGGETRFQPAATRCATGRASV